MVLRGSTITSLSISSSSTLSKTINTSKMKVSTSKPPSTQPSRLRVIKESVRDRKFLQNVADFFSKSRQTSTQKVCDAKCIVYTRWCHRRKVNPVSVPFTAIADFLIYLFSEKKYQISTIKGYRSMISNTLKFKTGNRFGRPRWLSWMRRPTGDQEVVGSTPAEVGNILSWRLVMKYFLRSFSLPLIQEGQLSVSGERMCTILVNHLED